MVQTFQIGDWTIKSQRGSDRMLRLEKQEYIAAIKVAFRGDKVSSLGALSVKIATL